MIDAIESTLQRVERLLFKIGSLFFHVTILNRDLLEINEYITAYSKCLYQTGIPIINHFYKQAKQKAIKS